MYEGYKIIVNTAAGRRRYMRLLIPYILESEIVDRYDLWINTNNNTDIEFFKEIAKISNKINLVWQPEGYVNGIESINAFYKDCTDPDTIYFKIDDDIIWMEPDLIEKMVKFRIDNPNYFLVSPLVINNGFSLLLLYVNNKFKLNKGYDIGSCWENGYFAKELHELFIEKYLATDRYRELYVNNAPIALSRFSINAVLWFGKDLKKISGIVPGNDEEFLTLLYPTKESLICGWNGNAILSHFAFGSQRNILDKTNILDKYIHYASLKNNNKQTFIQVQEIHKSIENNIEYINSMPHVYKQMPNTSRKKFTIWQIIPKSIKRIIAFYKQYRKYNSSNNFIEAF